MKPLRLLCVLTAVAWLAAAARAGEREEQLRFQGSWELLESGMVSQPMKINQQMTVAGTKITFGGASNYMLHLAPTREPRELDLRPLNSTDANQWYKGIYKLEGDMLTIYYALPGQARPNNFRDAIQNNVSVYLMKYRRIQGNR
jgi:uncharacterized protein (TIGR03067 family)